LEEGEERESPVQADAAATQGELEQLRSRLELAAEEARRARELADTMTNRLKYLMADFDNYRKQMDRQLASRTETMKGEFLLKFVNIRDDYVRALAVAKQSKTEPVVIEGLEGILKNIDSLLSSEGVAEIESVGTPFDPNVHDAISFTQKSDIEEDMVTAEIRKGYMLNDKVLRPSLVEISKKPKSGKPPPGQAGEESKS
jgi:molecular chaperone GrpE